MRKGPVAEAERDASQHAVGGIARISFFLFIFIQFKLLFLLVSTSGLNTFFLSGNAPGDAFRLDFVLKNAPEALFRNCFMEHPGGRLLRSLRYFKCPPPSPYYLQYCTVPQSQIYQLPFTSSPSYTIECDSHLTLGCGRLVKHWQSSSL